MGITLKELEKMRGRVITTEQMILVADEIVRGQKIAAIKKLREATSLGLKEAKDVIDRVSGPRLVIDHESGTRLKEFNLADRTPLTDKLKQEMMNLFPANCQWDATAVLLDQSTVEGLIAVQMAMLAEIKEMNELLRDVMEGLD